jgi:hypothetical protein
VSLVRAASDETRYAVASNLTVLSLMEARTGMPDPSPFRGEIDRLLSRIQAS